MERVRFLIQIQFKETDKQKEVAKDSQAGKTVVKETKAEKKQTSQKLKASWVNMQFGANDMYSNYFAVPKAKVEKTSVVKSEKTVLVASADNTASLPMFAKLLTDIEETTENRTEVLTTIAKKEGDIDFFDRIHKVREIIGGSPSIHVQVVAKDYEGILKDAAKIREQCDENTYIKSPSNT